MKRLAKAYFGCGCFWTKEYLFSQLHGVVATRTGFMGGTTVKPSYQQVCQKTTGHAEVVEVTYNLDETRFPQLLKAFFSFHDATRDRTAKGGQYRSVVFCRKAKEKIIAERALELLRSHGLPVVTQVESSRLFWPAAARHQGYMARSSRKVEVRPADGLEALSLTQAAALKAPKASTALGKAA